MKKVRSIKMFILIGGLLIVFGGVTIWFQIPYSPIKREFNNDINKLLQENQLQAVGEVFTEDDFSHLPLTIQRYIQNSGYIGTAIMSNMKIEFKDVAFMQGRKGPSLSIDYTQYNFVSSPCRMALIDSSMFGIPFEGYDYYYNGTGGMKGVIGKAITLFDQKGTDMDKACLATYLAEILFAPSILLQNYITFEEVSDFKVKATITYENQSASGIFTFNEQYEMVSFVTNDRAVTNSDGTMEYIPWTALCGKYKVSESGIKLPEKLQAVWNYPDGDFIYFDGKISKITYGF